VSVVWHDLECGRYRQDLGFWRELAARRGGPILDVGAGTGRVALELARDGHDVTALDNDAALLEALASRARQQPVHTVLADARSFTLRARFALCVVPMQTIQLLGGEAGRRAFLARAHAHLLPGGLLAVALADELDLFEVDTLGGGPLPDVDEVDGVVYSSRATAVRARPDGFLLERQRETVSPAGELSRASDVIILDRLQPVQLEEEARQAGFTVRPRAEIAATEDYVGSVVVMLGA
jgi:SAM-dependent methyltransferase